MNREFSHKRKLNRMLKIRIIVSLVSFLFLYGCDYDDLNQSGYRGSRELNIYLVDGKQIVRRYGDVDPDTLKLEKTPWISQHEISFYDWSAHTFLLKTDKPREKFSGRYFVVKSNEEPLFVGYFFPSFMSSFPSYPSVIATDYYFYPLDVVSIDGFGGFFNEKMDENIQFKKALIQADLFREGIQVELTGLRKKNASTVEYSYMVTNLDEDFIYVLDPVKMGANRFHYYTNGVSFVKGSTYYFSENLENTPSENIPENWYFRLSPGKSISRTVELRGFRSLPTGNFTASFTFPGASHLKSGEWKMRDGRIWVGSFYVKKEFDF